MENGVGNLETVCGKRGRMDEILLYQNEKKFSAAELLAKVNARLSNFFVSLKVFICFSFNLPQRNSLEASPILPYAALSFTVSSSVIFSNE